jgi:hypothetical protein
MYYLKILFRKPMSPNNASPRRRRAPGIGLTVVSELTAVCTCYAIMLPDIVIDDINPSATPLLIMSACTDTMPKTETQKKTPTTISPLHMQSPLSVFCDKPIAVWIRIHFFSIIIKPWQRISI